MDSRYDIKDRYIYSLLDPRRNKSIVYVGQSIHPQKRFKQHLKVKGENLEKDKWIDELNTLGMLPILKIEMNRYCSQFQAFQSEMCVTVYYRDLGYDVLSVSKEKIDKIFCYE